MYFQTLCNEKKILLSKIERKEGWHLFGQIQRKKTHLLKADTCYSVDHLFAIFGLAPDSGVSMETFMEMCPALIQQQLSKACEGEEDEAKSNKPTDAEREYSVWNYVYAYVFIYNVSCELVCLSKT